MTSIAPQDWPPFLCGSSFVPGVCFASHRICSSPLLVFLLILAAAFWLFQLLRSVCNLFSYWDIQVFYREALHIPPVSWMSVWRGARLGGWGAEDGEERRPVQTGGATGKRAEDLCDTPARLSPK